MCKCEFVCSYNIHTCFVIFFFYKIPLKAMLRLSEELSTTEPIDFYWTHGETEIQTQEVYFQVICSKGQIVNNSLESGLRCALIACLGSVEV